jgi:hypothetical protein
MKHSLLTYDPDSFNSMTNLSSVADAMITERHLGMFSPLEISPEAFKKAYELPIGDHVEKNYKGLSYLSWPFAFRYLNEQFPGVFVSFEEKENGWPVFGQEGCWLLRPYLTDGCKRTPALVFPLMDNKHNALTKLDARAVSDNIQRASVKVIATFTGLGLKLYAGEDIPKADEKEPSKLPLQQEAPKQVTRASAKAAPVAAASEPIGSKGTIAADGPAEFDGKAALLAVCEANPLRYADKLTSMKAGKAALDHLGLSKGEDIKDKAMFANVVTTMVTQWTKNEGIKVTKAAMTMEIDTLRAICQEGTPEQAVKGIIAYVEGKK